MFDLTAKVAIVTGAGQGLGRGIALALAEQGAHLVVADLNEVTANQVKTEIEQMGRKAMALKVDITQYSQVKAAVARVLQDLGKIDILVNNAGWDKVEPFISNTEETWDRVIAINLRGTINCCRAVLDHMLDRSYGKIINIASDAGRVGSTGEAVYSATKGGIIAFTKTLARETAKKKINVNCICPGPSDTPLFATIAEGAPKLAASLTRVIPLGRLGKPEDIGPAVAFFASDEASFITGQTLSVSGGLTMS
jgi:2-hydroxycyclohexanecarboxyl-CoA dehydrogenase